MNRFLTVSTIALLPLFGVAAQNQGSIGDFTLERVLTLNSVIAPTPPSLPPAVLAGFQSGAIEFHQVFTYNSAQGTLDQVALVTPGNSPVPYPNPASAPIGDHYVIQVDSVAVSSRPGPSVVLTGHVISNDAPTPWGDVTGANVSLAFGYQGTGSSVQYSGIIESVTPMYGLYTPTGAGTLSLNASPGKCGPASLSGDYLFQLNGSVQTGPTSFGPFTDSGHFVADGNGNLMVYDSGNANGKVIPSRHFAIAYVINDDCTGTFKWPGAGMDVQVSKDGGRMQMVFSDPASVVASGTGQRR